MADDSVEKVEVGKYLYVWKKKGTSATTALITAHGGGTLINSARPMKRRGDGATPNLHFYTPHGHVVDDLGLSSFSGRSPVETLTPATCPEYILTKYTNSDYDSKLPPWRKHNDNRENYHTVTYTRDRVDYDIVTIRSRFDMKGQMGIPLSEILEELRAAGYVYADINCAFCRGGKPEPVKAEAAASSAS